MNQHARLFLLVDRSVCPYFPKRADCYTCIAPLGALVNERPEVNNISHLDRRLQLVFSYRTIFIYVCVEMFNT